MPTLSSRGRQGGILLKTDEIEQGAQRKSQHNIVGPQVRQLRSAIGLSKPALAVKCQLMGWNIGRDTIARIEGRTRWVGDAELVHLAHSLAVPLNALFSNAIRRTLRWK